MAWIRPTHRGRLPLQSLLAPQSSTDFSILERCDRVHRFQTLNGSDAFKSRMPFFWYATLGLYFFAWQQITILLGSVPSPAYAGRIKPSAIHISWLASSNTSATHGSCVIQTQRTLSTTCPSKHGRLTCDLVARLLCTSASYNVHDNAQSALPTNMLTNDTLDSQTHAGTMEGRC